MIYDDDGAGEKNTYPLLSTVPSIETSERIELTTNTKQNKTSFALTTQPAKSSLTSSRVKEAKELTVCAVPTEQPSDNDDVVWW